MYFTNQVKLGQVPLSSTTYVLTIIGSKNLQKRVCVGDREYTGKSLAIIVHLNGSGKFNVRQTEPDKIQLVESDVGEYGLLVTDDITLNCQNSLPKEPYFLELRIREHRGSKWWVKKVYVILSPNQKEKG